MLISLKDKFKPLTLNLIAGCLLPLAFAPFNFWPLCYISLIVLLYHWYKCSARAAIVYGFVFGLGFFGLGVSWVFVSIHNYGNTNVPLAIIFTSMFIATLSLFPAIQGFILNKVISNPKTRILIGFPCSWVLFEWMRTVIWTGFPWLYLGYSHIDTYLSGLAPIIGVYGISFVIAMQVALCVISIVNFNMKQITLALSVITIIWFASYGLGEIAWTQPQNKKLTVSMIQGNLTPDHKFYMDDPMQTIWSIYGLPTMQNLASDFIIWPENSLPMPPENFDDVLKIIVNSTKNNNTTFLFGSPRYADEANKYYNSLNMAGNAKGVYNKTHLVPFGEFLPLDNILRSLINFFNIPMSNFKPGKQKQNILTSPKATILPLICYEIAYPEKVRTMQNDNSANVILNISEDGWFGNSFGPHQHLQITRMRALENGRYLLRSTTNGISAIIDNRGKVTKQSPQFESYILTGTFLNFTGKTPRNSIGQWPILAICVILVVLATKKYNFTR